MTVRVAIDLALDRLFAYTVPEELEKKLAVGQLLLVPFGHRMARGFALAIGSPEDACGHALKPVAEILDEVPFFSAALLRLVRQLADYAAAPLESVLKAALPAAVLKPGVHAKEQLFVEPTDGADKVGQLTARGAWLRDQIVRLGGGWQRQLCQELKTTPASLRVLAAKGAVTICARQRRRSPLNGSRVLPSRPFALNDGQRSALSVIESADRPVLLNGITGSGKTEVYLQAIAGELARGHGAIVMVPEISLTPQTVRRFAARFGERVAVLHSALSDGERYDEWHRIRSGAATVVVGPRSAVFAPVAKLGLIVVDEEHETSYKQDELPRYHARDVAVMRGAIEGAKVVLGSATPSLESWMNVRRGKYVLASMTKRAGLGTLPAVRLVDMSACGGDEHAPGRSGAIFSPDLLEAIRLRLDRSEQTMLFLNRRGYSRSVTCSSCGWTATCDACEIPYTYHRADCCLRCHVCGRWTPVPPECPECHARSLDYRGLGTQRAEAALAKCFPRARILRMDADSTSRKNSHDDILGAFRRGEADVLLGTQMIAKGLDFPNVTLVGVLNADSSLNMPDFRASERTYQLLAQVAGRAGRAELPGEVLVQTYDPSSVVLQAVVETGRSCDSFSRFAEQELEIRRALSYPPFCHLSLVNLRSQDAALVGEWADMYAKSLQAFAAKTVAKGLYCEVGDALPSVLEKADGWYRWQVVIRSVTASLAVKAWRWISSVRPPPKAIRMSIDIDAQNLL